MSALKPSVAIGVLGAGTMGAGIAQLAAAAGHKVILFDAAPQAAERGKSRIVADLDRLVGKGRMQAEDARAITARVTVAADKGDLSPAGLVVEAIVEDLEIKRRLFADIEDIVGDDAILATNTSSISVTSIARDLRRPERFVGMHFFNPATLMKLVEVISGIATARDVAETVFATAQGWGKVAVRAKSTPGFIVNRVARPYYGEALRLLEEGVADASTIDALMTRGGGFRMGPFELMDLIGHDVNYAVSVSVFNAYYQEPRFRPSHLQHELVSAGNLGRKSGRGIYRYGDDATKPEPSFEPVRSGAEPLADFRFGSNNSLDGVRVVGTDGRTAAQLAKEWGQPIIVHDLFQSSAPTLSMVGFTASREVPQAAIDRFVATAAAHGAAATRLPDWPGLVVMRTIAMLANEAFETMLQQVASETDIDEAMRHGVNYPRGPIEWAREIGLSRILAVLDVIHALTGDPRYRASLGLRMHADA